MNIKIGLTLSMILLAGCTSITEKKRFSHGYSPSKEDIVKLKSSNINKKIVEQKFGKPFVVGTFDPDYWYYISYSTQQYGFEKRVFTKFNIVELQFKENVLINTKRFNKDNLQEIAFNTNTTDTSGKKLGVFEQMIGNIGKFRTKDK